MKVSHRIDPKSLDHRERQLWVLALMAVVVLLTGTAQLHAQRRTATASLTLQVRPEELLQAQADGVVLKIRLGRGSSARLWAANACTLPSPQSYVIAKSGIHDIPYNALAPVTSGPRGSSQRVCLVSSDGVLSDSLPVEILATGHSAGMQGPTSPDVSAGVETTAQAGTPSFSNP
jgi:hypothetical protein